MNKSKMKALVLASDKITPEKRALVELAFRTDRQKPARADLAAMEKHLQEIPWLWKLYGDMSKQAERSVIGRLGTNPLRQEAVRVGQEAQRRELGYDTAPPLERGLIEHVILCRLRLDLAERDYSTMQEQNKSIEVADYWERRLSACQRRYLRACDTLARVRRLKVPAVQLNVAAQGGQQVNIVTQGAPAADEGLSDALTRTGLDFGRRPALIGGRRRSSGEDWE